MKEGNEKPRRTIADLMKEKGFDVDHIAESAAVTLEELQDYLSGAASLDQSALGSIIKLLHVEKYEIVHPTEILMRKVV
jgi:hypothetical protein